MSKLRLTLETVTPLLMNGADGKPELRAASFRGVFRYWLRAVLGSVYQRNITTLHEEESRYFGSTKAASPIRVQVKKHFEPTQGKSKLVLPPTVKTRAKKRIPHTHVGFHESTTENPQRFDLIFDVHPLENVENVFDKPFYAALMLAFHLGAFGKRARRGGGVLKIVGPDGLEASIKNLLMPEIANGDALVTSLRQILLPYVATATSGFQVQSEFHYRDNQIPNYPIFTTSNCRIFVGKQGYDDYLEALESMWMLTGDFHRKTYTDRRGREKPDKWAWGYAIGQQRRASALHMRVYQCTNGKYYPLATFFRSSGFDDRKNRQKNEKWWQMQLVIDLFENYKNSKGQKVFTLVYGDSRVWS